jgi:folylpolyglutamate synthase/dihydropteroate synthase
VFNVPCSNNRSICSNSNNNSNNSNIIISSNINSNINSNNNNSNNISNNNNNHNNNHNNNNSSTIPVIIDIAHNVEACKSFVHKIKLKYPDHSVRILLGLCADKNISEFVQVILQLVSFKEHIYCVEVLYIINK